MSERNISRTSIFRDKMRKEYEKWKENESKYKHRGGPFPNGIINNQRIKQAREFHKNFAEKYEDNGKEPRE